jgi:hypothetical protein
MERQCGFPVGMTNKEQQASGKYGEMTMKVAQALRRSGRGQLILCRASSALGPFYDATPGLHRPRQQTGAGDSDLGWYVARRWRS